MEDGRQAPLLIRLDVEAQNDGVFTMRRTELDSIPQVYDIWLIDKYRRDSLNLRHSTDYTFTINKKDSASFGSNRFVVVIRQSRASGIQLLSFEAAKLLKGAELDWKTKNEQSSTTFSVERSIDDGQTFYTLDSIVSTALGTYNYLDKTPIDGTDKYRLKIAGINGTISYSDIVSLRFNSSIGAAGMGSGISVYPNPSNGVINLTINPDGLPASPVRQETGQSDGVFHTLASMPAKNIISYRIRIININGAVIKTSMSSSASWHDNISGLLPGTYVILVINNNNNSLVGKNTFIKL